jgi:hypothetical protein
MVADKNALRGEYRMALVTNVLPDNKGRVRQVDVSYKTHEGRQFMSVRRDVRSLVILLPVEEK